MVWHHGAVADVAVPACHDGGRRLTRRQPLVRLLLPGGAVYSDVNEAALLEFLRRELLV